MQDQLFCKFLQSWETKESGIHSTEDLLEWIKSRNKTVCVSIEKVPFRDDASWTYDRQSGSICNSNRSFFSITGLRVKDYRGIISEQPIILQNEIGYLGIICKELNGILHFLMQAKIEPGNINKVQISPTIQATKSNFTKSHGGAAPAYLDYFTHAQAEQLIVDQIQSEQSSRFYKKRNRNLILMVEEYLEVLPSHRWMTLGQIKELMKYDNLVNMDTRTVLSCIPFSMWNLSEDELGQARKNVNDQALLLSMTKKTDSNILPSIYSYINNLKMFQKPEVSIVPLHKLTTWAFQGGEYRKLDGTGLFKVIYCQIEIEGREVRKWEQPLFEAIGIATFGLLTFVRDGVRKFVVAAKEEAGAFDQVELGPTVQSEAGHAKGVSHIEQLFWREVDNQSASIIADVLLSEEGGRFYHEQNRNLIVEVPEHLLGEIKAPYFEVDFYTLNLLTQINNCLNIQLRNLLSLLGG